MELAVATKEWLTVITSSPGPTPTARSARCSAVVQFETAQAWRAPTACANSVSKAATSGPCVTQPLEMGRRAASASRSSIHGLVMGMGLRAGCGSDMHGLFGLLLAAPPLYQLAQAFIERDGGFETEQAFGLGRVGDAPGYGIHLPLGAVFEGRAGAHDAQQGGGQVVEAGFDAAGDVEDLVHHGGFGGGDVGAGDVLGEDEVHGLLAVAEDERALAGDDALHPADQHFRVDAEDIHAGAVHVEVA